MPGAAIEPYFPEKDLEKPRKAANIVEVMNRGCARGHSVFMAHRRNITANVRLFAAKSLDRRVNYQKQCFCRGVRLGSETPADRLLPVSGAPLARKCRETGRKSTKKRLNVDKKQETAVLSERPIRHRATAGFWPAKSRKNRRKSDFDARIVAKSVDHRGKAVFPHGQPGLPRRRGSARRQCR